MPSLLLAMWGFVRVIVRLLRRPESRALLVLVACVLLLGMFFYHRVEGWSYLDSLYFVFVTLVTVGYGDFTPQTSLGKVFTIVYLVIGVGVLLAFIDLIAQGAQERARERAQERGGHRASGGWRSSLSGRAGSHQQRPVDADTEEGPAVAEARGRDGEGSAPGASSD